jgi:hypothetical protein
MQNNFNRVLKAGLLLIALTGASQAPSFAGFGDNENTFVPPGAQGQIVDPDPQTPLFKGKKRKDTTGAPPANGDFTADERDRQARFRRRVNNAHKEIDKGERLMQSCGKDHNKVEYKKGKLMKEIGEKDLASLKGNSPFPSNSSLDPDRPPKGKKTDSL